MKGLLIKDMRYTLQNKKMIAVFLFVAIAVLATQGRDGGSFIISYMTLICGMLVLTTISIDEFDKSITFLMTMPINRTTYAAEKYVFALLSSFCGWVISTIPCILISTEDRAECIQQAVVLLLVFSFMQLVILPVQLKFGGEKGRMVLIGVFGFFFLLVLLAKKVGESVFASQADAERWLVEIIKKLDAMKGMTVGIVVVAIWLLALGISFMISKKIMENKEY